MRIIVCNIQPFSNDQYIQVIDMDQPGTNFCQKVDLEQLPQAVCKLAGDYEVNKVMLHGGRFCDLWACQIKETYALNYGIINNFEVEVI